VSTIVYELEAIMRLSMLSMVGIYFIFSNTVMEVLRGDMNGDKIMVQINRQILNPWFYGLFIFSTLSSLYWIFASSGVQHYGGILFFVGTVLVTALKNVPLNNKLKSELKVNGATSFWPKYLRKWIFWNHVRTVSAFISGFFILS